MDAETQFGVPAMSVVPKSMCLILVHISSWTEIARSTVVGLEAPEDQDLFKIPVVVASTRHPATDRQGLNGGFEGTKTIIGCALGWNGISMTGDEVRQVDISQSRNQFAIDSPMKKKKKSSKKGMAKGRKKDGFARGMSGRG